MERQDTPLRKAIPLDKRIAIALYALGSSAEYRTIGNLFGVGKSTVCEIASEFCTEVWNVLSPQYLKHFPLTTEKIEECVRAIEVLGFPQCLGAIDGCHIEVHPKSEDAVDYFNYKGWYSIVLLALVYYRYRFLYINVGSPGRCNDSQIFEKSLLKSSLVECPLLQQMSKRISDVDVPIVIIGDSAFRFSNILMKPYPFNVESNECQKTFNYALSKCRRVVERKEARFRRIGKGIDNYIENAPLIIKACGTLHNFFQENNDEVNAKWLLIEAKERDRYCGSNENTIIADGDQNAEKIRRAIASFISSSEVDNPLQEEAIGDDDNPLQEGIFCDGDNSLDGGTFSDRLNSSSSVSRLIG